MHISFICSTFLDCVFPKNSHTLSVKRRENRALRHCPLKSPSVSNALYTIPINIFSELPPSRKDPFYTIAINICSEKAGKDATELSLVVIALSAPSGQRVAPILDRSPLNRTNCAHQKIGEKLFFQSYLSESSDSV